MNIGSFLWISKCLFGLRFLIRYISDVNSIFRNVIRWGILLMHVTGCDGKNRSIISKRQTCYGGWVSVELTEPLLVASIPNIHISITSPCSKCVVVAVEGDCVDWKYVLDAILFDSVALESILPFFGPLGWDLGTPQQRVLRLS